MELVSIILFSIALCLDGLGVGIAYGVRKIRVPVSSLLIISLTSATAIGVSMLMGHLLSSVISPTIAENLGAGILMLVGIWILGQAWVQQKHLDDPPDEGHETQLVSIRIRPLGVVIQIIKEPTKADLDHSGVISGKEALLLGVALAMDALGAGFGAAMAGFKPLITPLVVGGVKFCLVGLGVKLGRSFIAGWLGDRAAAIPGWVLIFLGLKQMLRL